MALLELLLWLWILFRPGAVLLQLFNWSVWCDRWNVELLPQCLTHTAHAHHSFVCVCVCSVYASTNKVHSVRHCAIDFQPLCALFFCVSCRVLWFPRKRQVGWLYVVTLRVYGAAIFYACTTLIVSNIIIMRDSWQKTCRWLTDTDSSVVGWRGRNLWITRICSRSGSRTHQMNNAKMQVPATFTNRWRQFFFLFNSILSRFVACGNLQNSTCVVTAAPAIEYALTPSELSCMLAATNACWLSGAMDSTRSGRCRWLLILIQPIYD